MVDKTNGHDEGATGGQDKPLSPQEIAAERVETQVDDHGEGGGEASFDEGAGRYRDPVTKRFTRAPEKPQLERITDPRERIAEAFAKARKETETDEEVGPKMTLPKQLRTGMTDEEVEEQIRLQREDEAKAAAEEGGEPGEGGAEPGEGEGAEPGPGADKPAPKAGEPVPLMITVDGRVYYVDRNDPRWSFQGASDEQVRNIAQMYWATQSRLSEANQLLDRTRGTDNQRPADQSGDAGGAQTPQASAESSETKLPIDRDKLGEIADRVQLGNRDEVVEALEELVSGLVQAVGPRQPQAPDIQSQVDQAFVQRDNQQEIDKAISNFEGQNPDIAGNKYLAQTVLDMAVDQMVEDMKGIGVTEEMLRPVLGKGRMIAAMYRNMRNQGVPLRTHGEVLDKAAERLRQTFNLPRSRQQSEANRTTMEKRVEQKRQLQQQPRSAGAKNNQGQPPRPLTRQEIVRQEKARRMPWLG